MKQRRKPKGDLSMARVERETTFRIQSAKGEVKVIVPHGATFRQAGQALNDAFEVIASRHHSDRGKEFVDFGRRDASSRELRKSATHKLKTSRNYRQRRKRVLNRSQQPLLKDPRHRFMQQNWQNLVRLKNPKCKGLPGLKYWRPTVALALMENEGLDIKSWDARDYKKARIRLRLVPAIVYSVKKLPL